MSVSPSSIKQLPSQHFILTFECSCESHNSVAYTGMHFAGQESKLNLYAKINQRWWWQGTGRHHPQCSTSARADGTPPPPFILQPLLAGVPATQRTHITPGALCAGAGQPCAGPLAVASPSLQGWNLGCNICMLRHVAPSLCSANGQCVMSRFLPAD